MLDDLLPLEINAQLTEINRALRLSGPTYITFKNLKVDFAVSMFSVLCYIDIAFPNCKIPYYMIYENAYAFVEGYANHIEKFKREEEGHG